MYRADFVDMCVVAVSCVAAWLGISAFFSFGVAPLSDTDVDRMVEQVKGSKMLDGFRGSPAVDRKSLRDVILRVSQLVGDFPEIVEMDLNPVRVMTAGAMAVDARIKVNT